MYEEDHLLTVEHLLHVLGRVHRDWVRPQVADSLDGLSYGRSWETDRLPRLMIPGLLQYEQVDAEARKRQISQASPRHGINDAIPRTIAFDLDLDANAASDPIGSGTTRLVNGCPELNDGWPYYDVTTLTEEESTGRTPAERIQTVHVPVNVHQAGFLLPGRMLRYMSSTARCLSLFPWKARHWAYPPIELAEGEPYFACGFTKVVDVGRPAAHAAASTVWHMPDKYAWKHEEARRQLRAIRSGMNTMLSVATESGLLTALNGSDRRATEQMVEPPPGYMEYELTPDDIL